MKGLLLRTSFLVALGVTAGLLQNALRPDGLALSPRALAAACVAALPGFLASETMSPAEASGLCADPSVLVADARAPLAFAQGHIAGAVHLPCAADGDVATRVPALLEGKSAVIVYGDSTAQAEAVADGLRRRSGNPGLRIVVLAGGFPAWENAGLACASGACPECAEQLHEHRSGEAEAP